MTKKTTAGKPTITCAPNGPYLVKNLGTFLDDRGADIETKPTIALCRCGASKNKPFCDGTHSKFGFSSEKLTDGKWDCRENYQGKNITVHDNRGACAHAGFCTGGLPAVWRMGTEPWIDPNGAGPEEIIKIIRQCPSGALSHSRNGKERRDVRRNPVLQVTKDGPYHIRGGVELENVAWGKEVSKEHYTLCRCGASKNKPFCDGSHWYVDFKDDGIPAGVNETGAKQKKWYRVADAGSLDTNDVRAVFAGTKSLALVRTKERCTALDGKCPHQGGPLGEGVLENGVLRCPWHGWDFDPCTGAATETERGSVATYPVEIRSDGIFVEVEEIVEEVRTVSDIMVETMINWGVRHVFGMVGHSNLGLAEAIRKQEAKGNLEFIGIRHEGAAAFACSGYAKLSGKPAACLTIAGPGATNLLTGLWDAKVDRAPVLALTGQVNTQVLGPGAFQEVDLASAFQAVAAFSQTVLPTSRHSELMTLALKTSILDRNVGHLIFPDEVQVVPVPGDAPASGPEGRTGPQEIAPPPESLAEAVKRIKSARHPAIIVGYGARAAMPAVIQLAERLGAPVLTTFKAKGQISDRHPLAAGVLGRSGTPIASWFMNRADLLLVFGASFSDHTGIEKGKPIVQVDFERMALGKFHPVEVPVWGEIGITAEAMLNKLPRKHAAADQRGEVAERWRLWRKEKKRRMKADRGKGLNSATVFAALTRHAPKNAVVAVDVGNNTYSFGRYFECRDQTILMSGYLGSIGFGFPAAMGAWAADRKRPVIAVTGDGGFGQYLGEFTTAVKYGMNITHVLLNNSELGKISKEQRAGQWEVWQTSLHNPDFSKFARNCGGFGVRVKKPDALDQALKDALMHPGPALIEILTDSELI